MTELQEKSFRKGEVIYREHDYEAWLYVIRYGSVSLYQNYGTKDEVLIKTYGDGGYFGELELVEARPRTATAVANEKTLTGVVTAQEFSVLFREKPSMVVAIMQQMSARIRELQSQYNDACRVVAESLEAEKNGREKSGKLQKERQSLSDFYHAYLRMLGGNLDQ